jgi:hypothetical protein
MAKIAIVGCGAMGSVYAALMVDAGYEVHAVTLWPDHAEAMATNGLRCEGASGDRTVPIHASTRRMGSGRAHSAWRRRSMTRWSASSRRVNAGCSQADRAGSIKQIPRREPGGAHDCLRGS